MSLSSSKLKNHFSPKTGVSLSLPEDWIIDDLPKFDATYRSTLLSEHNPNMGINRFIVTDNAPDMHHTAAVQSADRSLPKFKQMELKDITLSDKPATLLTYSWYDTQNDFSVVQQFVYAQLNKAPSGTVMVRIITTCPKEQWLRYKSVCEQAFKSIRFIPVNDQ